MKQPVAARAARPAPNPQAFDRAVRQYDATHPIHHAAVRSLEVDQAWIAAQLLKRRKYLLNVARSFGLGDAALSAVEDPLDAQLDELERVIRPELIARMTV